MAFKDTIYGQFEAFLKKNSARVESLVMKYAKNQMDEWVNMLIDQADGFYDVTGNTITGYFVGAYLPIGGQMKLIGAAFSGDELREPTRLWLKKGETYDLPIYYNGNLVTGEPFTGSVSNRNADSFDEAIKFLHSHKPSKAPMAFLVGNSVDYAKYLEVRDSTNILDNFLDDRKRDGWIVKLHGKD